MTLSTTIISKSYPGNGVLHSFAYNFKIFADTDLTVIVRSSSGAETIKTLNTHYIVTGAGVSSGGNILFKFNTGNASDAHYSVTDQRPQNGETVVIRSELANTQTLDLVANDPFPAETLETNLDKLVRMIQQHDEALARSIKISRTNTMASTEFTTSATDRQNKLIAFDSSGELSIAQEIGTFKGNWATSTTYTARDIIKDTSTNNIFIVTEAHTSSGSQPLTTNANSAKYTLIVDAAASTTSQNAAAASASAAQTAQGLSETARDASITAKTASETAKTAAEAAQAAAEAALDTFDDRFLGTKSSNPTLDNDGNALLDGALFYDTTLNVMKVYDQGNTQWLQLTPTAQNQTAINAVNANATNINNVNGALTAINNVDGALTAINNVNSDLTVINAVNNNSTNINAVSTNSTNINAVANGLTNVNNFADRYRIGATDPTTSLDEGDLFYNSTSNLMKVYNGSQWIAGVSGYDFTVNTNTWTKAQIPSTFTGTNLTLDFDTYQNFIITLASGSNFLFNPTTESGNVGQTGVIIFVQPSSGNAGILSLGGTYETSLGTGLSLSSLLNSYDLVPYVIKASGSILLGNPQRDFS